MASRPGLTVRSTALEDGRQSARAAAIARGAARVLAQHDMRSIAELTLASGRRPDLFAIGAKGEMWIVEVKSSLEDFRSDQKWPEYRDFCDRLLFAVGTGFPIEVLPADIGLIVADRFGGEMLREAPLHLLPSARRRSLLLEVARVAAGRLMTLADPEAALEPQPRE
jgi:hypothetical protein